MTTTDQAVPNEIPAQSLSDNVSAWVGRVKEARRNGDYQATLNVATAAADSIEQQIGESAGWTEDEKAALTAVKSFTYGAAADAWPGWELDGPTRDAQSLATGKGLAERSAGLVKKLQLGPIQEGTGIWLVGAFDLASGHLDDALTRFSSATQLCRDASAPGLVLLFGGYEVIARGLRAQQSREDILKDLEGIFAQLSSGGFEDGVEWVEQLRTALLVFSGK